MNKYVKLPFIMNIAGFCGSGKSYFIQYLIKCLRGDFDCLVIFSNTASFTNDYEFLNELGIKHFIFTSLEVDDKIKGVMKIQKNNRLSNNPRNVLIIFDDIFGTVRDSKVLKDLITTYRHYRISIIFSAQYVCGAASYLREISSYIVIFNQRTLNALKITFENYFASEFENFAEFKKHFTNKLRDYHFYFIDRIVNKKYIMMCPSSITR